ncbi:GOLPH3/VPS74 family protein [Amycolatopsis minnesotensis]|uniref:Golgi phosphoprotein 3 GPP34 n=1 Tax=Amycolatopsis minnesotensis TaxID=337894 RepID=A0ABP5CYG0_9PSEU
MLLAHDLLLLLLDDESGKLSASMHAPDKALAGAVLIELALNGAIDVGGAQDTVKPGRVKALDGKVPAHPVLRSAAEIVRANEGRKPDHVLGPIAKGLREELADELVREGILRRQEKRVLGLFPVERLPAADSAHEDALRTEITAVLAGQRRPDERTGPLISLLSAMNVVTRVFDVPDARAAKQLAKEIAKSDWAAAAVRRAVEAVQSAAVVAVVAATSASAAGSG